jgi:hypothetical protein
MTGVPLIINGIPLNLNGRNIEELQLKKQVMVKLLEFPWYNCSCDLNKGVLSDKKLPCMFCGQK